MINIFLAEDHVLVRKAIKTLFENEGDIKVTGEADNTKELLTLVDQKVDSDIILTELSLPGMDPASFIKNVKGKNPDKKVIYLSMHDDEKDILNAISAGANGFLSKSVDITELLFAIRHVYNDSQYICCHSTQILIAKMLKMPEHSHPKTSTGLEFSVREIEILLSMGEGFTNYEIAEKLFTSKRTVESHRQNLLTKTGSRNTAALIKFAVKNGIIEV